ncbi:hypothetical protein [Marivivens marinus]|uniref:hypothetical protein n=1 Tax=Marivivens marinus TaxID=3110173 RepID=UPI003B84AEFF
MAELWCCGKSGQSFRKASRIAVGILGADGKRKPTHAAQLAFQKRGGSQTRKPPPLIESVAERLARRLSSLDKQGLAIPLSLFCVFRQECSASYARSHPNARVALRLSSLSEITDLEQTVLSEAIRATAMRCEVDQEQVLKVAAKGETVWRRIRARDINIFS